MPMVTVSISPEQAAKMREAVESGAYASGSEVIRAALRLWAATSAQDSSIQNSKARTPRPADESMSVADLYAAHEVRRHG